MKFNWGHGIGIFYLSFMAILIFFVVKSAQFDHSLVVDNYYEEDLKYQNHYDKLVNDNGLDSKVIFKYKAINDELVIQFPPDQKVIGTALFYRPSDKYKDFTEVIVLNESNEMVVDTRNLARGPWKVKLDWVADSKSYFKETLIVL